MTESDYTALAPREADNTQSSRLFAFYRIRGKTETRFFPGAGATLHFASKDDDTLSLPDLPEGFLKSGDSVRAAYKGKTVFRGRLVSRTLSAAKGTDRTESALCAGPWHDMARLVYRQYWFTATGADLSSRLVLNQYEDGSAQSLSAELREIASQGAAACGYTVGSIPANSVNLPFDECRDITVADALRRELRLFPKYVCRFDYAPEPPAFIIARVDGAEDAAYLADIPQTARRKTFSEDVITGVDLEIETTGENNGVVYRQINHQRAGDTSTRNPSCLYATLQLAGASSSTTTQTFDSKTEDIGSISSVDWWKSKHPRLANVAASAITISNATRTGSLPRISASTAGELEAAGLQAEVDKFTCTAKIDTADDVEENLFLTMHFLTTNAKTKKYTFTTASSSTSGESVPLGLAKAILDERSSALRAETIAVRLGDTLPVLGDAADGLILQSFDVDCDNLVATLNFGAPEWLSPEDMAGLLTGFRNKRTSTSCWSRASGKPQSASTVELGGIPPLSSTEFAPGTKAKTTIAPTGEGSGKIVLDPASLSAPEGGGSPAMEVHTLTVKATPSADAAETKDKIFQILATQDIEITPGSGESVSVDEMSIVKGEKDGKLAIKGVADADPHTILTRTSDGVDWKPIPTDNVSITINPEMENYPLSIYGFYDAPSDTVPTKTEGGGIEWKKGGGGTIKGNTADSVEISLSGAVFRSADDSNVEIKTDMVSGVPTITIGVYYVSSE